MTLPDSSGTAIAPHDFSYSTALSHLADRTPPLLPTPPGWGTIGGQRVSEEGSSLTQKAPSQRCTGRGFLFGL
jgi:hypothetical protein